MSAAERDDHSADRGARLERTIGIVAAAAAVPAAIVAGRPLSTIIGGIALLAGAGLAMAWVARTSGIPQLRSRRRSVTVLVAAVLSVAVLLFLLPASRGFMVDRIVGWPDDGPVIHQVTVVAPAVSAKAGREEPVYRRVRATLGNTSQRSEAFLKHVSLTVTSHYSMTGISGKGSSPYRYAINSEIAFSHLENGAAKIVGSVDETTPIDVVPVRDAVPGQGADRLPVAGEIRVDESDRNDCRSMVSVGFDVSVPVPVGSSSTLEIDLPDELLKRAKIGALERAKIALTATFSDGREVDLRR